jgi:nicotinate-nucleotide adenylyltransferase
MRIGLLGGSFNPAHAGHRHVAELARRRLRLQQVWFLVSPGNPLKPTAGMAAFGFRLASARAVADGRRIIATAIEAALGTRYTIDTMRALRRRFPRAHFVWLMGADILEQLPHWRRWREIVDLVPFAVLPRPTYNHRALAGLAAQRLRHARRSARAATALPSTAPPAWVFLTASQHAASATAIRAERVRPPKEQSYSQTSSKRRELGRAETTARPTPTLPTPKTRPPGVAGSGPNTGNAPQESLRRRPARRSASHTATPRASS